MIKSLIPSFFLLNLSSAFPFASLIVFVLSIFLLQDKTSSRPIPQSVSSLASLDFKGVIDPILLTQINISSLLMSHSLRIPPSPL